MNCVPANSNHKYQIAIIGVPQEEQPSDTEMLACEIIGFQLLPHNIFYFRDKVNDVSVKDCRLIKIGFDTEEEMMGWKAMSMEHYDYKKTNGWPKHFLKEIGL